MPDRNAAITRLSSAIDAAAQYAATIKATQRDDKEPDKSKKERFDKRMAALLKDYFDQQRADVERYLESGGRLPLPDYLLSDESIRAEITKLLIDAAKQGIAGVFDQTGLGFDNTLVNKDVAKWAAQYAGELINGINKTSLDVVRSAIADFADKPGFTIGDVMAQLPFDADRAARIAVTEITRAYAESNQLTGEQLAKEFGDVPVIKMWFTNNDDRVCPVCGPLNGREVGIKDEFVSGISNPPAHPNCRCWTTVTTKING